MPRGFRLPGFSYAQAPGLRSGGVVVLDAKGRKAPLLETSRYGRMVSSRSLAAAYRPRAYACGQTGRGKAGTPGLRVPASLRPGLLMLISFRPREESRPNWANCKHRDLCEPSPPTVMHRRVDDRSAEFRAVPGIGAGGASRSAFANAFCKSTRLGSYPAASRRRSSLRASTSCPRISRASSRFSAGAPGREHGDRPALVLDELGDRQLGHGPDTSRTCVR